MDKKSLSQVWQTQQWTEHFACPNTSNRNPCHESIGMNSEEIVGIAGMSTRLFFHRCYALNNAHWRSYPSPELQHWNGILGTNTRKLDQHNDQAERLLELQSSVKPVIRLTTVIKQQHCHEHTLMRKYLQPYCAFVWGKLWQHYKQKVSMTEINHHL